MFRWALALLLLGGSAQAATLQIVNGLGAADFLNGVRDTNNAFSSRTVLCDASNPDTCAPVSATGGLTVTVSTASSAMPTNLTQVNGTGIALGQTTMSASLPVTLSSNQSTLHITCDTGCTSTSAPADEVAFTAGTTTFSPTGGFFQTTATNNALTNGQMGAFQATANRALFTNLRNAAGTEIGTSSTPVQVSLANTAANATAVSVAVTPQTSGGLSMSRTLVANNTTAIIVKSGAGQLFGVHGYSIAASAPVFIKFYNATSQTCGTGSPVWEEVIPASGGAAGSGLITEDTNGKAFGTGIAMCITAGFADADTTAPAASTYIVDISYK